MGNVLFNIRFGMNHLLITKDWKFSLEKNTYHKNNPKWFEVYTFFGKYYY